MVKRLACVGVVRMRSLVHENVERYEELAYDAAQTICDIVGIWEGRREGIKEGIKVFIKDKIEDGVSEEKIIYKLKRGFQLNDKSAKEYYKMYS